MGHFDRRPALGWTFTGVIKTVGLAYRRAARSAVLPKAIGRALSQTMGLIDRMAEANPSAGSHYANELTVQISSDKADQIVVASTAARLHTKLGETKPAEAGWFMDELAYIIRKPMAGSETREYVFSAPMGPDLSYLRVVGIVYEPDVAVLARHTGQIRTENFSGNLAQFGKHAKTFAGDQWRGKPYQETAEKFRSAVNAPGRPGLPTLREEIDMRKSQWIQDSFFFRDANALHP